MVIEILNSYQSPMASVQELKAKMATLRKDWSRVEVMMNETLYSPFNVLIEQVKREIRICGFILDEEPNSNSIATIGDSKVDMCIFYCSPGVLVVTHFNNEEITFSDGYTDVKTTLAGIQVMELD